MAAVEAAVTATDKKLCTQEARIDGSPSHVEIETCLDMTSSGRARH
jgi:hypothetical protein